MLVTTNQCFDERHLNKFKDDIFQDGLSNALKFCSVRDCWPSIVDDIASLFEATGRS
jgi:hypothetical protein